MLSKRMKKIIEDLKYQLEAAEEIGLSQSRLCARAIQQKDWEYVPPKTLKLSHRSNKLKKFLFNQYQNNL